MLRGRNPTPGGLLKPAFGLSGDLQISFNFVIPTGTDHRKAMIRGVEGPAVVTVPGCDGRAEIDQNRRPGAPGLALFETWDSRVVSCLGFC